MSITRRTIGQLDAATCVLSTTEVIIANGVNTEKTTMAGVRGFVTETLSTFDSQVVFGDKVGIGMGPTGVPNNTLTVIGDISATGTLTVPTLETDIEATDLVVTNGLSADGNTFTVNNSTHKVGIGTSSPNNTLTVIGDISATGTLTVPIIETNVEATDLVVTNGLSAAGNTFTVNASTNKVGIGTSSPNETLTVAGNISATGGLEVVGALSATGGMDVDGKLKISATSTNSSSNS